MDRILITTPTGNVGLATLRQLAKHPNRPNLTLVAGVLPGNALPELKIRVVNVVDLLKLQHHTDHPHGLTDADYNALFTADKPVIFAFHGYPWLVHRLTYNRANNPHMHVHGYREEGTITTAFDMTVLNKLDRFHLVMNLLGRLPQLGNRGAYLVQHLKDKLIDHKRYIRMNGEEMPGIRDWTWKP